MNCVRDGWMALKASCLHTCLMLESGSCHWLFLLLSTTTQHAPASRSDCQAVQRWESSLCLIFSLNPLFFHHYSTICGSFRANSHDKRLSGETLKKAGKSAASLDMSDVTFSLMPFIFTTWSGYNLLMIYWVFFLCLWICLDETRVHMCWQEAVCAACMQAFTPCHALSPKVHESDGRRQGDRERRGEGWRSGGATP